MSKLAQEKEEVKALIRGLLTSSKEIMTANALFHDFKNMTGYEVPYRRFGFPNFEAFLRSIPDTVMLQHSGGLSCNVLLVTSEKSKHIDELVQKQKINTKKKGPRRPTRYTYVAPGMAMGSSRHPFIPQFLQKRILEYVAEHPHGVELQKLQAHLWIYQMEKYGDFECVMRRLTHIVKLENGILYPVNHVAPKYNVQPPQINASLMSNVLPSGYENENSTAECDDWEYSWSSEEETATKSVNDKVTEPANDTAHKEPTGNSCAAPTFKQPAAQNVSESALKQPKANCDSEPTVKHLTANCVSKSPLKQPTANKVGEQALKQPRANNCIELSYKPRRASNFSFHEPVHSQPTTSSFCESAFKQPTANSFSESVYFPPPANKFKLQMPGYRQPTPTNNSTVPTFKQQATNSFIESTFKQTTNGYTESPVKQQTANSFTEPSFKQQTTDNFSEPGYKQPSVNNVTEPANRKPTVNHLSDPAAFSTFMPLSKTELPKLRETTSTSHISEKMKKNLQILAEKYPDGIWCSELPKFYQKHFGVDLNVQNLGFVTVVQFVADIPEVFQCIQPTEADWMVFDAKRDIPEHLKNCKEKTKHNPIPEHVKRNLMKLSLKFETGIASDMVPKEYLTTFGKPLDANEWGFDSIKAFLLSLQNSVLLVQFVGHQMIIYPKHGVEKELARSPVMFSDMDDYLLEHYPADVVGPNVIIPQQDLPPDLKFCDNIEVVVSEVSTPCKFWLQLRGTETTIALDKLMTDMQDFYNTEYNNELYKMREPTFRELQYCVAPYCDEYHRALIVRVFADEVQVKFIDYGTVGEVKKRHLRHLHYDFATLPAQGIRAKLANLQPVEGPNATWPLKTSKRFLELVCDKPLVALVHTVDYQMKVMEVALVDTTGEDDVHINDTLKKEGYADYCRKKKESPASKKNMQVPTSKEISESDNKEKGLFAKTDTGDNQNAKKVSYTSPSTSTQAKVSDDEEEPIKISTERRVLPPPGFSRTTNQQLPSMDSMTLVNMALYQQALQQQQQQQQQMLQNLMMSRHPEFFLQGNSSLGTTLFAPYAATNTFPVLAFPVAPIVMPNITQVPAAANTMVTNVVQVAANTSTVDSATMTTFEEEVTISELTDNLDISVEENKVVTKVSAEENTFQNDIPVEEEVLDEDFIFRSDSEEEETDNATELEAGSQQERKVMKHLLVVTNNNYENVNTRQSQPEPQQHTGTIIGPTSKISQPGIAVQPQKPVDIKVVEIAQNKVHIINIKGEPHMCTDELVHVFTNFSSRHIILKKLESKGLMIPFKEIKKVENPKIFHALQSCEVQGLQKPFGILQQIIHMIPLHHVVQLLTLLKINDAKLLLGVHAALENCRKNKHFWFEPVTIS